MKKKLSGLVKIILVLAIIGVLFVSLIGFITDFLWFKELSYVAVFFTQLKAQILMGVPTFLVISILMFLYLKALKRGYFNKVESDEEPNLKKLRTIEFLLSAGSGLFVAAAIVTNLWWDALQFFNSTSFGIDDPLFGHDISFYIFRLDFIQRLNEMLIGGVIIFIVATILYYTTLLSVRTPSMFEPAQEEEFDEEFYERAKRWTPEYRTGKDKDYPFDGPTVGESIKDMMDSIRKFDAKKTADKQKKKLDNDNVRTLLTIARNQIIILGVILFAMVGINFWLRQYDLLHSSTGVLYGAGFTDVNITLWVLRILAVLAVIAAIMWAIGVKQKKIKTIVIIPVVMLVVGLVGTGAAELVQNFIVSPDEINKERQYLERNIAYTQMAYDLGDVDIKEFSASNNLTAEDIANNQETINNIRINDYEPAERFYNQTQAIRQYYLFDDTDVDRYMINGEYTQVFLSAREIDETKISQEWLNKHLKYTHGYGVTLSRVDSVTASGQPDMMISGIPPVSSVEEITIDRPEIYFGELANNYILVNTDEEEFDYPDGSSNVYTMYEGNAGIKMSFLNKVMFAIRENDIKLFVATNVNGDSKIVINRNIEQRVHQIMPFLSYDSDPYIVAADGNLYWIIDAYTTSSNYPYSEPYAKDVTDVNYIRNSVKVVIDAYNGDTDYYIVDEDDPMALTMQKIYPTLFKDFDEMPEALKSHIRYPNTLFQIQAQTYARYHMEDVNVFYQGEDIWDISNEIYGITEQPMTPNYYIMKLPGEEKEEFVNTIPYTPRDKDNMTGLLVARNDGDSYGELVLYQLPKSKVVYGPMQIEAQIDQNTEISKEFSLWNSSGSTYTRGNLFVIPIEDSLIYVEPVYLEATNSSIPEVKRVIVAYNDRIAYEETLAEALASLFGTADSTDGNDQPVTPGVDNDPADLTTAEIITLANEAFSNAETAMQNGNWAQYGEYLDQLETYLNMLAE